MRASRSSTPSSRSATERSAIRAGGSPRNHGAASDFVGLRELQLRKLQSGLKDVLRTNAFWRERLHKVRGWDDFERFPLTTKSELVADQASHPPFGTNLTYPLDQYVRLHQTSGSSGDAPLRWLDTA